MLISIAIISFLIVRLYKDYKKKYKDEKLTVQEWHQLDPISQRYESKSIHSGYVYFVQESGNNRIKIGKAKTPEQRIQNDFGTIMPYEFNVVHLIKSENYHKTENLFHHCFNSKRYKGEWFDLTIKDVEWIKKGNFPREIEDSIKGY